MVMLPLQVQAQGAAPGQPLATPKRHSMRLINRRPSRGAKIALGALPFIALIAAYMIGSGMRLAANPDDKLLPSLGQMGAAIWRMAFQPEQRSGDVLLWTDTYASLW